MMSVLLDKKLGSFSSAHSSALQQKEGGTDHHLRSLTMLIREEKKSY